MFESASPVKPRFASVNVLVSTVAFGGGTGARGCGGWVKVRWPNF